MSNSKEVTPEGVDEDRGEFVRGGANNNGGASNNMQEQQEVGNPPVGIAAAAIPRRDENSISFRHFLQPHSDVVPSPAPTCRSRNRGPQPGSLDLVDMAMALPDFVQDHLVVESLAIADHQADGIMADGHGHHSGASSLDLNVLNEILPDFASSQSPHGPPSQSARRRNIPEESSSSQEVPLGAAAGASALPDFLSDGPMQCTDSNVVDNTISGPSPSRSTSRILGSGNLAERNRIADESSRSCSFDTSETLRSEVERLRREITERNRRISQLESEVVRLRTSNNALENALRSSEQNLVGSESRRLESERQVENLRSLIPRMDCGGGSGDAAVASASRPVSNGYLLEGSDRDLHAVRDIALSSETLISQLLQNMARLKEMTNVSNDQKIKSARNENCEDQSQNK